MIKKGDLFINGWGMGQAYDCDYMKKLARAQRTSVRPIHLVISERGAITDDLGARNRSKNILIKVSSANTYRSFCKARSSDLEEKNQGSSYKFLLALKKCWYFRQKVTGVLPTYSHLGVSKVEKSWKANLGIL